MPVAQRYYAVVDPRSDRLAVWQDAWGRDWIELETGAIWACGKLSVVKARLSALKPGEILAWALRMAVINGRPVPSFIWEAYHGEGILIDARNVHVCRSVEDGRQFWASDPDSIMFVTSDREGGGEGDAETELA